MTEVGERVGAILDANADCVRFLGYGTYVGREVPPSPAAFFGFPSWEAFDSYHEEKFPEVVATLKRENRWPIRDGNPKIELDSGKTVWGQECWWGPEEQVREHLQKYRDQGTQVVDVDIEEVRNGNS